MSISTRRPWILSSWWRRTDATGKDKQVVHENEGPSTRGLFCGACFLQSGATSNGIDVAGSAVTPQQEFPSFPCRRESMRPGVPCPWVPACAGTTVKKSPACIAIGGNSTLLDPRFWLVVAVQPVDEGHARRRQDERHVGDDILHQLVVAGVVDGHEGLQRVD